MYKFQSIMPDQTPENGKTYNVVINEEEQYSIWPTTKDLPNGWQKVGVQGLRDDCLSHIKEVWTDMRPLSLRSRMAVTSESEN
ncbi:Protein MbtH (modular protein) [Legionella fallonii LLAP-10]|uniref:Protein MbtH (Modular protein) n=2 Tax=Legionella fallonii TaxID=96230 RepID=A0A098GAU3_9GAMM|nr:Protein MbtH (modular protein) [Legionella fallonii LLAP-10]